jgi:cellulose synthase/poly-beta-1,6-N-acetylglucosamine synthase-like glycosyltransferase
MNILTPKSSTVVRETPFVSVVVPHYNDLASLDLCLKTLQAQTYPRAAFEIIIADNASPQGAAEIEHVIGGRAALVIVLVTATPQIPFVVQSIDGLCR